MSIEWYQRNGVWLAKIYLDGENSWTFKPEWMWD